jgi:hypothetical protein
VIAILCRSPHVPFVRSHHTRLTLLGHFPLSTALYLPFRHCRYCNGGSPRSKRESVLAQSPWKCYYYRSYLRSKSLLNASRSAEWDAHLDRDHWQMGKNLRGLRSPFCFRTVISFRRGYSRLHFVVQSTQTSPRPSHSSPYQLSPAVLSLRWHGEISLGSTAFPSRKATRDEVNNIHQPALKASIELKARCIHVHTYICVKYQAMQAAHVGCGKGELLT